MLPFDGACWHTLDPGSDLITQHRLQDIPDRFPVLADNEYAVDDVNKFAELARAARKAATLSEATGGHPERSPRFRDLLAPAGIGPELRSAFVADGTTWGALILVRRAGRPEFEERDVDLLVRRLRLFARAVRRGLVAEAAAPAAPRRARCSGRRRARRGRRPRPRLLDRRAAAGRALRHHGRGGRARTGAAGGRERDARRSAGDLPTATVRTPAGRWLVLHGGRIGTAAGARSPSSCSAPTRPSSRRSCSRRTG